MFNPRKKVRFSESNRPSLLSSFFELFVSSSQTASLSQNSILKPSGSPAVIEFKSRESKPADIKSHMDACLKVLCGTEAFQKNTKLLSGFLHALAMHCQDLLNEKPLSKNHQVKMILMTLELFEAAVIAYPDRSKKMRDTDPIDPKTERVFLQYIDDYWQFKEKSTRKKFKESSKDAIQKRDEDMNVTSKQFRKYAHNPEKFLTWVIDNFVTQFNEFFKEKTDIFAQLLYRMGETFELHGICKLPPEIDEQLAEVFLKQSIELGIASARDEIEKSAEQKAKPSTI